MSAPIVTNREKSSPITGRIGRKLRSALLTLAQEGTTKREAARRAGMNETALGKALRKPYVARELDAMKASVAAEIAGMKAHYRTLALEHAWYLAKNAKSEAVQARMVELLAGETRSAPMVNVTIGQSVQGYEYLPPGARLVEIEGTATDLPAAGSGEAQAMHADEEGEQDQ